MHNEVEFINIAIDRKVLAEMRAWMKSNNIWDESKALNLLVKAALYSPDCLHNASDSLFDTIVIQANSDIYRELTDYAVENNKATLSEAALELLSYAFICLNKVPVLTCGNIDLSKPEAALLGYFREGDTNQRAAILDYVRKCLFSNALYAKNHTPSDEISTLARLFTNSDEEVEQSEQ